ncbi:hypothetical protein D3C85_721100 [compost metagenome]
MVEVAVVLVEVDEQHGLAPHLGHGGERIERFLDVPAALHWARRAGVLGVGGGCHDPRHLRQLAVLDVLAELLEEAAVGHGVGDALVQRVAGIVARRVVGRRNAAVAHRLARGLVRLAVLLEARERVVAVVLGHVLVGDPAHLGFLQPLGVRLPFVAEGGGADLVPLVVHGGHARAGRAVGAGPVEHAVRVGARVHAAVVVVAQREGIGQRELQRQLGFLEIAHRDVVLVARPLVGASAVPGVLAVDPRVRRAAHALRVPLAAVQVVGQHGLAGGIALLPDVQALGQRNGEAVTEAAHAHERAEVVVERAVLLHQDDDVLDVLDGAGLVVGRNGEGAADGRRKGRECECGGTGGGGAGEEVATGIHGGVVFAGHGGGLPSGRVRARSASRA